MQPREKPSIAFYTLGCKLNQAESERLGREFMAQGYQVSGVKGADVIILNTCTVTHAADSKARHMMRLLRKNNPGALIVVTGCYAERAPADIIGCGADMAVGNQEKMTLPQLIEDELIHIPPNTVQGRGEDRRDRVRSFIKIQDGCSNYCTYCIVPYVRPDVYCIPAEDIMAAVKARVDDGYREVVLTGTEIGSYMHGQMNLKELIEKILKQTEIKRLHLSSLQPHHLSGDLIEMWQDTRLCRHFHIALQSGSDFILKSMNRRYNTHDFLNTVNLIRCELPDASITSDVMVGFPGETESEFEASYRFCRDMQFAAIHVFSYSPRPGTKASVMPGRVSEKVKKERSLRMLKLAAESADNFGRGFTGQIRDVLWENEVRSGSGVYSGLTDNYMRVYCRSREDLTNRQVKARMTATVMTLKKSLVRATTKGNYGELWSEVII
jgi:threonylcarbamoyladenosine tRNA methylthiotransferase MtaB